MWWSVMVQSLSHVQPCDPVDSVACQALCPPAKRITYANAHTHSFLGCVPVQSVREPWAELPALCRGFSRSWFVCTCSARACQPRAVALFLFLIKLLEENKGRTLSDINPSKIFFDPPPRIMKIKTKVNKWDLINHKSFCAAKTTITKWKDSPQNGEKYLQTKRPTGFNLQFLNTQAAHAAHYQKIQTAPSESRQKIQIDLSPKKTRRGRESVWKGDQRH